jgi:hypothetical protein
MQTDSKHNQVTHQCFDFHSQYCVPCFTLLTTIKAYLIILARVAQDPATFKKIAFKLEYIYYSHKGNGGLASHKPENKVTLTCK